MHAAYSIGKNAKSVEHAPAALKKYKLTYYRQWSKRFKEDLDFLFAVNKSHIFIAFRGTTHTANTTMNNDGRPNLEYAHRVHTGWWRAAEKAWKKELSSLVKKYRGDRKILVTGHSMGGAVAAYVTKQMQKSRGKKKALKSSTKLRLVTFGAPRYTFSKTFLSKKNTLIFTVETTTKNQCVDRVVWDWQIALRKSGFPYKKVDTAKPTRKEGTYYRRCKTKRTHQKDEKGNNSKNTVHGAGVYLAIADEKRCEHVKYKACAAYSKYVD